MLDHDKGNFLHYNKGTVTTGIIARFQVCKAKSVDNEVMLLLEWKGKNIIFPSKYLLEIPPRSYYVAYKFNDFSVRNHYFTFPVISHINKLLQMIWQVTSCFLTQSPHLYNKANKTGLKGVLWLNS